MTPFRADGGAIELDHATGAVPGPGGSLGLWNTRIAEEGSAPGTSAGLTLRPLGSTPPIRSAPVQRRVACPDPGRGGDGTPGPPAVERARRHPDGVRLLADVRVGPRRHPRPRPAGAHGDAGVLFPYGHRAVYVEVSDRCLETTAEGAIAHLRKRSALMVTEPVKRQEPSRAFPFTEVRIQRTLVEFSGDPILETRRRSRRPRPRSSSCASHCCWIRRRTSGPSSTAATWVRRPTRRPSRTSRWAATAPPPRWRGRRAPTST